MKKALVSFLVLVAFTFMVTAAFAADAAAPAAAKAEPVKADVAKEQVIKGVITKIDTASNTIVVKGKTFTVKAEDIANLKKGENVKITAAAGSLNADKIEVIKAKKAARKAAKKSAAEKKADVVAAPAAPAEPAAPAK
jgi:hypothetical protein